MSVKKVERNVFSKMTPKEQEQYLTQLYHGRQEHLLLARIQSINSEQMAIEPLFFLNGNDEATRAEFFDNVTPGELVAKREDAEGIEDFSSFCQARNLQNGQRIICDIVILPKHEGQRDFTFDPYSIDRHHLMDVANLYRKYQWEGYDKLCTSYRYQDVKSRVKLLLDDVEQKCYTKIGLCDAALEAREAELETLDEKLQKRKSDGEARIDEDLEAYRAKFDREKSEVDARIAAEKKRIDEEVGAYQKQLEEKGKKYENLLNLFHAMPEQETPPENAGKNERKAFPSFDGMMQYAQQFLKARYGLEYSLDILKMYMLALQTDQLILLVGKSGTGKSSLVRYFPEVFGFEQAQLVPVHSNWNDKGDLLGYYNPIDKTYVATPFLDKLLCYVKLAQQEEHKNDVFFLCLDEMNLAHVEYYFAEFLSELQKPEPEIRLYSDTIREDIVRELRYNQFTDEMLAHPEQAAAQPDVRRMGWEERRY